MTVLPLLTFLIFGTGTVSAVENIGLKVEGIRDGVKVRICEDGFQNYEDLSSGLPSEYGCEYLNYTCTNIGQRSELFVSCKGEAGLNISLDTNPVIFESSNVTYTVSLSKNTDVNCQGIFLWSEDDSQCACKLGDSSSTEVNYRGGMKAGDFIAPGKTIMLGCSVSKFFEDYTIQKNVTCGLDTDLASYNCQSKEELKEFDNKVAHFEGTLDSFVIMDSPFTQELTEFALCFWLRTKDAVGSVFSLANEDHWNALRFDTHSSHIHFTMAGLHTDHGLVPKIQLKDDHWRYFCANWDSNTGNATVFVRQHGEEKVDMYSEVLPLSKGESVRATGGKLALGNLWNEDVVDMTFNPIGSLEGDVMGLTLFNTRVNKTTFNSMFDSCSTILDPSTVVLSWKSLLSPKNELNASATYGQQVCSKGYRYGEDYLNFPLSNEQFKLSDNRQNYAKIENAFSIDLKEFTICTLIKSDVKIGTIFSYVTMDANGFKEEIVLEKHKTHMHFYMAGVDQQVGAVPAIAIDTTRWYTTCFTWDTTGQWRGYLDGEPKACGPGKECKDLGGSLEYTVGKTIMGGGTCYLGVLKTFNSFREFRGYAGDITELNLWGRALTAQQIRGMVNSNEVYEDELLVSWGTLLKNKRGDLVENKNSLCPAPAELAEGSFTKTALVVASKLYGPGDMVRYECDKGWTLGVDANPNRTCHQGNMSWVPDEELICSACQDAGMFTCDSGECLSEDKVCDGTDDCEDASDEDKCSGKETYWLLALLLLFVPFYFLVKKGRVIWAEKQRVKKLTDTWEVKREHLELADKLGEGAFGKVFKGYLLTKPDYDTPLIVAVKELSDVATERDKNMFLEEIRLSKKLGNHPNIVGIVGSIIVYEPSCLILEFVDGGDLLEFLHKQKDDPASTEIITQDDQVFFAWQIANGMEYVSGRNFVHRDLAARNILISSATRNCKITDFGLARDLYNYDEYQSEGGRLPIKWMSPEAIFDLKFTTESDVWSFGVTMYELFSWGGSPYPGIDPALLRDRLVSGYRMAAPNNTPDFIYSTMVQCWEFKSADRPKFSQIRQFIEQHLEHSSQFKEFQKQVAADQVNQPDMYVMCDPVDEEEGPPTTPINPTKPTQGPASAYSNISAHPSGEATPATASEKPDLEYQNLAFKDDDRVVFKNDYKVTRGGSLIEESESSDRLIDPRPDSSALITTSAIVHHQQEGDTSSHPEDTSEARSQFNIQYAELEFHATETTDQRQVNIGFADEKGLAEITRSEYMNT